MGNSYKMTIFARKIEDEEMKLQSVSRKRCV